MSRVKNKAVSGFSATGWNVKKFIVIPNNDGNTGNLWKSIYSFYFLIFYKKHFLARHGGSHL